MVLMMSARPTRSWRMLRAGQLKNNTAPVAPRICSSMKSSQAAKLDPLALMLLHTDEIRLAASRSNSACWTRAVLSLQCSRTSALQSLRVGGDPVRSRLLGSVLLALLVRALWGGFWPTYGGSAWKQGRECLFGESDGHRQGLQGVYAVAG